jgi:hypothetical protein
MVLAHHADDARIAIAICGPRVRFNPGIAAQAGMKVSTPEVAEFRGEKMG